MLCATTRNTVEFTHRNIDLPKFRSTVRGVRIRFARCLDQKLVGGTDETGHIHRILDCAFSVARRTKDNSPSVILDRTSENFRSRCREPVDDHTKWTLPCQSRFLVAVYLDTVSCISHLNYGTLVDKKAGQFNSLLQRTASIIS